MVESVLGFPELSGINQALVTSCLLVLGSVSCSLPSIPCRTSFLPAFLLGQQGTLVGEDKGDRAFPTVLRWLPLWSVPALPTSAQCFTGWLGIWMASNASPGQCSCSSFLQSKPLSQFFSALSLDLQWDSVHMRCLVQYSQCVFCFQFCFGVRPI